MTCSFECRVIKKLSEEGLCWYIYRFFSNNPKDEVMLVNVRCTYVVFIKARDEVPCYDKHRDIKDKRELLVVWVECGWIKKMSQV